MSTYPEHDKLAEVKLYSQEIYDFLCWLEERNVYLGMYDEAESTGRPVLVSSDSMRFKDWLAEFFDINLDALEQEKRAMLATLREAHDAE